MGIPKISIIIPVYQSKKYLPACLDSIFEQSFTDWELLLIDDGSTDGSGKLCDEYASSSKKIRVFHQENGGISAGRNTGLDHMRGEYIAFVDSDDVLISRDYLKLLYEAVVDEKAEMSVCRATNFTDGKEPPVAQGTGEVLMSLSGEDAFKKDYFSPGYGIEVSHGRLFLHDLFKDVRYPVGRNMEDFSIMHQVVFPCKKIVLVDKLMYGHRVHADSVFQGTPYAYLAQDIVYGLQDRIKYFESIGRLDLAHNSEQKMLHFIMNQKVIQKLRDKKRDLKDEQ